MTYHLQLSFREHRRDHHYNGSAQHKVEAPETLRAVVVVAGAVAYVVGNSIGDDQGREEKIGTLGPYFRDEHENEDDRRKRHQHLTRFAVKIFVAEEARECTFRLGGYGSIGEMRPGHETGNDECDAGRETQPV